MSEREFGTALLVVIATGSLIFGAGAALLYAAFRAYAEPEKRRHLPLISLAIGFILLCSLGLFLWAWR